jgi:DNA-binding transcriptional ArsR family regulator
MDLSRPYRAVCPALDSDVLAVLAGTLRPLTGREVARLARDRSPMGVRDVLNRLTEQGLVERREAGRALLYALNREHLAAPAVIVLAGMRTELLRRIRDAIDGWDLAPVHASLFGSAARGDGDTTSDIDVFIIRPRNIDDGDSVWRNQLDALGVSIERWTGNYAAIADVSEAELPRLRAEDAPIVRNLRDDAVPVHGPTIRDLLGPRV